MDTLRSFIALFALCYSAFVFAELDYEQFQVNYGAGTQTNNFNPDQENTLLGFDYFFKRYSLLENSTLELRLGLGFSQLETDQGENQRLNVFSVIPQLYYELPSSFGHTMGFYPYTALSIAPSIMDDEELGFSKQEGRFIFNDTLEIGAYFGRKKEFNLKLQWRHLSNGGIYNKNPGIDVPIGVSFGWQL